MIISRALPSDIETIMNWRRQRVAWLACLGQNENRGNGDVVQRGLPVHRVGLNCRMNLRCPGVSTARRW